MEVYQLFLIIPPGLEDLALAEIEQKVPTAILSTVKGGIEVSGDLEWIEKAHQLLKIPTRILMRLTEFKVRDFPKLYQKFLSFKWTGHLSHPHPHWEISCSKSRLNHTGRIEETIKEALEKALIKQPLKRDWEKKNYPPQTFYVRIADDNLTLSLDLTGEPLYKRGLQVIKGEAPIRENFAAAFVAELFHGVKKPVTLVDPMCGSGTLLTEALTFNQALKLRPFAFETAPFYKGRLLRKSESLPPLPVKAALGIDINGELIKKVSTAVKDLELEFKVADSTQKSLGFSEEIFILTNPPYGERIKIAGKRGVFLKEAWEKFLNVDQPKRFGWVLPSDMDDLFNFAPGYRLLSKRHLKNGGMAVTFWIWEKI